MTFVAPRERDIDGTKAGIRLFASVIVGMAAIAAVFGVVLQSSYRATQQLAIQTSTNISALIEQDIARNIELYNLSFEAVVEGFSNPRVMALEPSIRQLTLFDRSATAEGLGGMVVLNDAGDVILDSQSVIPRHANFKDRDYFQVHKADPNMGLFISKPFQSRLGRDAWSIGISRRIAYPDGQFAGVIVGIIRVDYFRDVFRKLDLGQNGEVALLDMNGAFLAREPQGDFKIGESVGSDKRDLFESYKKQPIGYFEDVNKDGIKRLWLYRKIKNLPLVLFVGLSTKELFADWWMKALTTSLTLVALCILVVVLSLQVRRELARRRDAENLLTEMATTDALTGLCNRRRFDELLETEWARALREQTPLSILMLDSDRFKAFNDRYGHQAGDVALRAIAKTIQDHMRRPADQSARYGGEEFAVILPNTTIDGAMIIADAIRLAVAALAIPHHDGEEGVVTLSAGVACAHFAQMKSSNELIREADVALYEAKNAGRNRVRCAYPNAAHEAATQTLLQSA